MFYEIAGECIMKRIFLVAVALAALATAAKSQKTVLPNEILGTWCLVNAGQAGETSTYTRIDCQKGTGALIVMGRDGYQASDGGDGPKANCRAISPVTLIKSREGFAEAESFFQVQYRCNAEGQFWIESTRLRVDPGTGELTKISK